MPRYRSYLESTTNEYLSVDLAKLKALGMLERHYRQSLSWSRGDERIANISIRPAPTYILFKYCHGAADDPNRQDIKEVMPIVETPCNYGGTRKWFACLSCNRRVRILYGGKYFRCRKCYGLKYNSQYEEKRFRYLDYARDIQRKVAGEYQDVDDPLAPRPKGMHRKTYRRLQREYDYYRNYGFGLMYQKLSGYV